MENLISAIRQGIIIEDEFIQLYLNVIKDEGFLKYFPDQNQAQTSLEILIKESQEHKQTLEDIINKISYV